MAVISHYRPGSEGRKTGLSCENPEAHQQLVFREQLRSCKGLMDNQEKRTDYERIARYLANECSGEEMAEIEARMDEDPLLAGVVRELRMIWNAREARPAAWDVEKVWKRISLELDREERSVRRVRTEKIRRRPALNWMFRAAALVALGFATALFTLRYMEQEPEEPVSGIKEVVTDKGQRAEVRLSDGSRIRMNAESTIRHPAEFDAEQRFVHLTGEAYFEITPDDRPFYVFAENTVIRILGTEFNVNAYAGEEAVEVVVTDGTVAVGFAGPSGESAILNRGDMARLLRNEDLLSVTQGVDVTRYTGWLEYRLEFEDLPMKEVATRLERWYGVEIRFADPATGEKRLSASFQEESIQEVLRVLQLSLDLEAEIGGRTITLRPAR